MVAAIVPWNFPVALVVWKLAPALAAGCAVVVKPAQEAPLAAWALCDLAERVGPPARAWSSCLTGDGPLLGEALATHPRVAKVAFTGSRRVAEQIARWAAPRLKALSLELGGHGPLVVLPDADLDVAAEVAVVQGYVNSGQACYAVNRVLVPPPSPGTCSSACAPASPTSSSGRWPPTAAWRATACCSTTPAPPAPRWRAARRSAPGRLAPALVTGAGPGVRLVDEEPFTPIVAVMEVADTAAAIAEANRPDYGLVGYVGGRDLRGALETAQAIACGTVVVNGWRVVVPYAPYAGWRGSGVGTELGRPGPRGLRPLAAPARPGLARPAVHAPGEDQLLDLGPRPRRAAVADPAHHEVGVLVERALVDQHPRRAQAPPPPPRPARRPPPPGRRGCRWRAPARRPASSATTSAAQGREALLAPERRRSRAARGSRTTVGVK